MDDRGDVVKALTLHQPWASFVMEGAKKIETRSWSTKYRGRLAIHAAKSDERITRERFLDDHKLRLLVAMHLRQNMGGHRDLFTVLQDLPRGEVLGTVDLHGCLSTNDMYAPKYEECILGDYSENRYAWYFRDVRPYLNPVLVRGRQGLWNWDGQPSELRG